MTILRDLRHRVADLESRVEAVEDDTPTDPECACEGCTTWGQHKALAGWLCIVGAALVAMSGHDGWGWLLFIAFMIFC